MLSFTAIVRVSTLHQSVVNWDESLYGLMALSMLDGYLPYEAIWDNKPPGIYLVFALGVLLFGDLVLAMRVLSALGVATTACVIGLLALSFGVRAWVALLVALLFPIAMMGNWGLSANTEAFFIPLAAMAAALVWHATRESSRRRQWLALGTAGVLLALGAQIKYFVVFDAGALGMFWMASHDWRLPHLAWRNAAAGLLLLGAPVVVLAVMVAVWFAWSGAWAAYYDTQIVANVLNSVATPFSPRSIIRTLLSQARLDALLWGASGALAVFWATGTLPQGHRRPASLVLLWLMAVLPAVFVTKLMWGHYFLQLYPQHMLALALVVDTLVRPGIVPAPRILLAVLVALAVVSAVPRWRDGAAATLQSVRWLAAGQWRPMDVPARVAALIAADLKPTDTIYVVDAQPIIYVLTGTRPPTRYAFPPHVFDRHFSQISRVEHAREVADVFGRAPMFVIRRTIPMNWRPLVSSYFELVDVRLARDYTQVHSLGQVDVYRRTSP